MGVSKNPSAIIAEKRKALHLTQQGAAVKAGLPLSTWAIIEQGKIENPRMDTCLAIAEALGCQLGDIWTWAKT